MGSTPPIAEVGEARWFRGEIIDPKCFAGAMKPGTGKTHKACAALCLRGGIPPAFLSDTGEIRILTDVSGNALTGTALERVIERVGEPVQLKGVASSIGAIPVLKLDASTLRR
jgi:hypothetical protein